MLASQKHKCRVSLENQGRHWSVSCKTCEPTFGWIWNGGRDHEGWLGAVEAAILHAEYHWIR